MRKRFLIIPVNERKASRHFSLFEIKDGKKGELLYDFMASYDGETPCFDAFLDITRFGDVPVTVEDEEGNVYDLEEAEKYPDRAEIRGGDFLRPKGHFTAGMGRISGPGGLIYHCGKYHIFYCLDPLGTAVIPETNINMSLGHAVSDDLFHWEDKDISLFPDEKGNISSGCSVTDYENAAGFGKDSMILFCTAEGDRGLLSEGKKYTLHIAYSVDGGETFTRYEEDLMPEGIRGESGYPKAVFVPELGKYVMARSGEGDGYELLTSEDLINFTEYQRFEFENGGGYPDLFPLFFEDKLYWVFQTSNEKYIIVRFRNGRMEKVQDALDFCYGDGMSFAPQVFYGTLPRVIRVSWLRTDAPETVFGSQMCIPCEIFLIRRGDVLRLGALPVKEMYQNAKKVLRKKICGGDVYELSQQNLLRNSFIEVDIETEEDSGDITLECFGQKISICPSGNTFSYRAGERDHIYPLSYENKGKKRLKAVFDTLSCEIFADGGLIYSAFAMTADRRSGVVFTASDNAEADIIITVMEL